MKGATALDAAKLDNAKVSIHAPNEGSDYLDKWESLSENVSIHAPNEGSDFFAVTIEGVSCFNPRSQ